MATKQDVRDFWDRASCGEELYLKGSGEAYANQARERYQLEPYILPFADFESARDKSVLEIGVGLGADHENFARAGAILSGIDLTPRAVAHTGERFARMGLKSDLAVGDAENLPFPDNNFDIVYSYGVLHHSPQTQRCFDEVFRVLKPGGIAKIMVYHTYSMIGFMLWLRYAGLTGKWNTTLAEIYSRYLESPGTKAYTSRQAAEMLSAFRDVEIQTVLTHADLLSSEAGQRHRGLALSTARAIWPRWLIKTLAPSLGLHMLISARKLG